MMVEDCRLSGSSRHRPALGHVVVLFGLAHPDEGDAPGEVDHARLRRHCALQQPLMLVDPFVREIAGIGARLDLDGPGRFLRVRGAGQRASEQGETQMERSDHAESFR
jgi:hypothetical protein